MQITNQQKKGIIQLSLLILFCLLVFKIKDWIPVKKSEFILNTEKQALVDQQIEQYNLQQESKKKFTYYVNSINDYKAYLLGLNTEETDKLLLYLKSKKLIYSLSQFQKITNVDSLKLKQLKSQLRFPKKNYSKKVFSTKLFDLNTITLSQLNKEVKLSEYISKRFLKFRKYLSGFRSMDQIEDIYGIKPYQVQKIKKHCFLTKNSFPKKNLNQLSQKELSKIPYISWTASKQIINFVKKHGKITSFEILRKFEGFSTNKINRLPLYLTLE